MKDKFKKLQQKLFNPKIQSIEIQCYVYFFFIFLIIGRIIPIQAIMPRSLNDALFVFFAISGALLVLQDLLTERALFKTRYWQVAFAFMFALGLSSLINIQYGWINNLKTIVWFGIQFFLIYALSKKLEKNKLKNLCTSLIRSLAITWTVMCAISIFEFLAQIGYRDLIANYGNIRQGFYDNRLFGVFSDPNFASFNSLLLIIFSALAISESKKSKKRRLWIAALTINTIYLILSGSRTTAICLFFVIAAATFFILRNKALKAQKEKFNKTFLLPCIAAIIAIILSFGAFEISKTALSYLPSILFGDRLNLHSSNEEDDNLLNRDDVTGDISNNRSKIWSSYLSTMKGKTIVFGYSPRNALPNIIEHHPENYLAERQYIPHSDYIAIVVYTGIIGSIIALIGIGALIFYVLRTLSKKQIVRNSYIAYFCIIIASAIYGVTFMDILFVNTLEANAFWLIFGLFMNLSPFIETKNKKQDNIKAQNKLKPSKKEKLEA